MPGEQFLPERLDTGEILRWTLRRPEVTAAIVGLRNASQIEGVIGAAEFRLSAAEIAELKS